MNGEEKLRLRRCSRRRRRPIGFDRAIQEDSPPFRSLVSFKYPRTPSGLCTSNLTASSSSCASRISVMRLFDWSARSLKCLWWLVVFKWLVVNVWLLFLFPSLWFKIFSPISWKPVRFVEVVLKIKVFANEELGSSSFSSWVIRILRRFREKW